MDKYLEAASGTYKGNSIASFIRNDAKIKIIEASNIDTNQYIVEGSAGKGNWAEIPWISIFDKHITKTATQGYYIVYLFRADMSGVYLSLNQGWTYFKEKYGISKGKENIKKVSDTWKLLLRSSLNDFDFGDIDLHCTKTLGKGYELGHICGKFYPKEELPEDKILINDLRNLLGVYREVKGYIGNRSIDEINKYLISGKSDYMLHDEIEDPQFQRSVELANPITMVEEPQEKPESIFRNGSEEWKRNPSIARDAIIRAGYICEVDPNHKTFTSNVTKENFVEAHHLIPMRMQHKFKHSLDVPGNIVSLCPNCHRAIHYATPAEKRIIIQKLYNSREHKLRLYGIYISLDELISMYI